MKFLQCNAARWVLSIALIWLAGRDAIAAPATIRMIAFGYNSPGREWAVEDAKGASLTDRPVNLPMHQCSPALQVNSRALVFTQVSGEKAEKTGKPSKVTLSETGAEFILVFLPLSAEGGGGYAVHAMELPSSRFKSGAFAFLNYSDAEISCAVEKQRLIVQPAKSGIITPEVSEGIVKSVCFEKVDGKWPERPFFSGRLPVQRGVRNLVLVSRNPATGRIDFRGVPDFISGTEVGVR